MAGLNGESPVKCSRNVLLVPDESLEDAIKKAPFDVVILPGGLKGMEALAAVCLTYALKLVFGFQ